MPFRPYHTALKKQVDFQPLHEGEVRIYNCGPTVYGTPHIGNFRSFLFADTLRRYLEWRGYKVTQIMNITDVGHLTDDDVADAQGEDKLGKIAREKGWDPYRVANHFEDEFHRDRRLLGCVDAHQYPRATDHIPDMLALIQKLLESGHAYFAGDSGDVYFSLESFEEYGRLANRELEDLLAGARIQINTDKKHAGDFALWKTDDSHLMQWDPHSDDVWRSYPGNKPQLDQRFSRGFPGWHVECSAMSMRYLGETLDIHTGGEDNIFPHHECEIAQSTSATGKTFSRYWMHARFLLVDNKKMSKRAGTLYTLEDLTKKGFKPVEVRYLLTSNHYRQPMNFTLDGLHAARASIERLTTCRGLLKERADQESNESEESKVRELVEKLNDEFRDAMDDDLNTPNAFAKVFEFVSAINQLEPKGEAAKLAIEALESIDGILGVMTTEGIVGLMKKEEIVAATSDLPENFDTNDLLSLDSFNELEIRRAVAARQKAKNNKDYGMADAIRDALKSKDVVIEDTAEGVRYKVTV